MGNLLQGLAMLRNIETFQLVFLGNPQRHKRADQLQQQVGYAAGPRQGDRDAVELDQQLLRIALDQAGGSTDRGGRKHSGQQDPVIPPMPWTPNTSSESS